MSTIRNGELVKMSKTCSGRWIFVSHAIGKKRVPRLRFSLVSTSAGVAA